MVRRCTVQGCNRDKEIPWKTYGLPAIRKNEEAITTRRQNLWLKRLNLLGKNQSIKDVWVCDAHFLSGKPSYYMDERNPDWAPSQNIGSTNFVSKSVYERYKRRKKFQAMRAKTPECLLKKTVSYRICHQTSAVSSSSLYVSSDKDALLSKEIEVKKKITHQIPNAWKKQEKLLEVLKNQSDIVWMDTLPVEDTSQASVGEKLKLGKTYPSNVAQVLKSNHKEPEPLGQRIENENSGINLEQGEKSNQDLAQTTMPSASTIFSHQMVRKNPTLFVSNNTTHDHDYCIKPICENDSSKIALEQRCPIDHDYCRMLPLYGPPVTVENDSDSRHILPQTKASIQHSQEGANIDEGEVTGDKGRRESAAAADAAWDFILPDIPREVNGSVCNRCSESVSHLKLDLERKSATLEHRLNDLSSLKQELELAREHIDKLRARLEDTTNTLCSYFSKDGKSS